jgi:general secretion pathway protein B
MSLILDALDRSDQDRSDPVEVPGVHTQHGPVIGPARRRWPLMLLLLAVPLLLVLAWMRYGAEEPGPTRTVAELEPAVVPAPTVEPTPAPVPAPESVTPLSTTEVQPSRFERQLGEPVAFEPEPAAPEVAAESPVSPEIAALYASHNGPTESASAPDAPPAGTALEPAAENPALDVEVLTQAALQELETKAPAEHPVPLLRQLSQRQKDTVPSVYYSEHHWNGSGSSSSVVLNGNKLEEGESVARGMELEEILEDSVVLNYQGTRFRLRSLNSWVNL